MILLWDSPVVDVDFPNAPQAAALSRAQRPCQREDGERLFAIIGSENLFGNRRDELCNCRSVCRKVHENAEAIFRKILSTNRAFGP